MTTFFRFSLSFISVLFIILSIWIWFTQATINFTVTPIRYELNVEPGTSITRTASIRNNGNRTVTLWTTVSDFEARNTWGTPQIVRRSELVFPDQQLSSWITLSDSSVTLEPWEEWTIEFTINVPQNATPGWHYGAVLFKHDGSQASSWWNVWIDVDYWVILLVEVAGDIIVDIEIEEPVISNKVWYGYWAFWPDSPVWNLPISREETGDGWFLWEDQDGEPIFQLPDSCPLWDFSGDRFDGRCFPWEPALFTPEEWLLFSNEFWVEFSFPINNKWNTHVRPTGKVVLRDDNWNIIPAIWKEAIANEYWAVIWERVVDHIPINDEQWNVLPWSKRIFQVEWKGFPYQDFDERWNAITRYWTPSEYYTRLWKRESWYLMPWEVVVNNRTRKNITADIEMRYRDINGNERVFNAAKEFPIQYTEEKIILNPYILLWFFLLIPIFVMIWWAVWWWFIAKREIKCWNCHEKIKAHWETCPYCEAIQDKRRHNRIEKFIVTKEKEKGGEKEKSEEKQKKKKNSKKKKS